MYQRHLWSCRLIPLIDTLNWHSINTRAILNRYSIDTSVETQSTFLLLSFANVTGESPLYLFWKQFHAYVIGLFTHHIKFEKQLHVDRKKQAIMFHVKMQRLNHVSHKIQILSMFAKHTDPSILMHQNAVSDTSWQTRF